MVDVLRVVALVLVALAMVPSLAHALELPGKLRLGKEAYLAVQPIYYPGFTVVGVAEPAAIVATGVLLAVTPAGSGDFWLTLVAGVGLVVMHALYWLWTHSVNKVWLRGESVGGWGSRFFAVAPGHGRGGAIGPAEWTRLRDRWEYSHVARAVLAGVSFVALAIAVASAGV